MKSIIDPNSQWKFSTEPFPAYRISLVYGANKRSQQFIPIVEKSLVGEDGVLKENKFKLIITQEKKTLLIVDEMENSSRCLWFGGVSGGFRDGCRVRQDKTTATILKTCQAGNNCESRIEVAAIFAPNQKLIFESDGRRNDDIIVFSFENGEIIKTSMPKKEFEAVTELNLTMTEDLVAASSL